ncbi:MAG: hypothetical protein ACRC9Q_09420 [Bacteroidales bacterium]
MQDNNQLQPKKDYFEPMHTAEHILNQTMDRMFSCGRAISAHIERKKSKCDYLLSVSPTEEQMKAIEDQVNRVIDMNLDVTNALISIHEAQNQFNLEKLPENAGDTLRIVKVGDYDACPCIGMHVSNTSEIGRFVINNYDYSDGKLRIRYKLQNKE